MDAVKRHRYSANYDEDEGGPVLVHEEPQTPAQQHGERDGDGTRGRPFGCAPKWVSTRKYSRPIVFHGNNVAVAVDTGEQMHGIGMDAVSEAVHDEHIAVVADGVVTVNDCDDWC